MVRLSTIEFEHAPRGFCYDRWRARLIHPSAVRPAQGLSTRIAPARTTTRQSPSAMGVRRSGPLNTVRCVFLLLVQVIGSGALGLENVTNKWAFWVGTYSDSSPAIATDGTIYFGTFTGKLW